jgi:hypothetical protein
MDIFQHNKLLCPHSLKIFINTLKGFFRKMGIRPETFYDRCHFLDNIDKFIRFGGRYPGKLKPSGFKSHIFNQILKKCKFPSGIIITFQVITFPGMSPGYPDTIRPFSQSGEKKLGTHLCGAGDTNHPNVGRVFQPTHPRQIRSTITAIVA